MIDGSSYRVFASPKESPNALEENPADATASPFGWHDTNGAPGPEFTTARGNNVHAYTDHNNDNAPTGGLPAVVVDAPSPAAGTYDAVTAAFGPAPTEAGVSGAFVVVNDAVGTTSDGCEPFALPAGSISAHRPRQLQLHRQGEERPGRRGGHGGRGQQRRRAPDHDGRH